jgi:hypothetical protein
MLTLLVILLTTLFITFIVGVIKGLIAISPFLLVICLLPVCDWFLITRIFKKKKKDK